MRTNGSRNTTMKRAMSVWFPSLSTDLLRRRLRRSDSPRDARAIVLITTIGQRQVVHAACHRARARGVGPGMPAGEAGAVLGHAQVRIEPHDPRRDAGALHALALWAHRFSPTVALDEPDGLFLDATGCAQLFGGEAGMATRVRDGVRALGFEVRAAIAPTWGAAWAVAHHGPHPIATVSDEQLRSSLDPLPIRALRLEDRAASELIALGIERVEDLIRLPRAALPARFGGAPLLRLDQALGRAIETIVPLRPTAPPRHERVFDGPTDRWEVVALAVQDLLERLCTDLQEREAGARRVELTLDRVDLPPARLRLSLSRPSREARHLWGLARPRLERLHLGHGIDGVLAVATSLGPIRHEQLERWSDGHARPADRAGAELIDTLVHRLGAKRVMRAGLAESHVPERAVVLRPALAGEPETPERPPPAGDRPTRVYDPPRPTEVMASTPDGPVMALRRGGEHRRVISCIGPERIGPEWWRGDRAGRDYFKAQDETGRWMWLYRDSGTGRWFIHGEWA